MVFLFAGLFSNFYTSSSIEILIVVQTGLMAAYGVLAYKKAKDEEDTKNLIDQSFTLGFIYSVGVVLMLVNAKVVVYSLVLSTAPIGYFVCIAAYLGFAAYYVQVKHSLKVNIAKSIGVVLLVGVVAISIVLETSGAVMFTLTLTEIWILIAAVLLGIAASLLTKGITIGPKGQQPPSSETVGSSSTITSTEADEERADISETEPKLRYLKLGFQASVRQDLLEIEPQLNFKDPKPIQFKSWSETETALKRQYIDNESVYGIIDNISRLLTEWNAALDRASLLMLEPDSKIHLYIQSCEKYYAQLKEIGFLD